MAGPRAREVERMIGYRFLILAALSLVIGLIVIYPALDAARQTMYGVPGL